MTDGTEDPETQQDGSSEAPDPALDQEREDRAAMEDTRRLVELYLCEEGQLESFRDTWLPPGTPADAERLSTARAVLHRLAGVLKAPNPEAWLQLDGAAAALDAHVAGEAGVGMSPSPGLASPPGPAKPPMATMVDGSAAEAVSPWARVDSPEQERPPGVPPQAAGVGPTAPGLVPTPTPPPMTPDASSSAPARVTPPPPPSSPTELSPGAVPPTPDPPAAPSSPEPPPTAETGNAAELDEGEDEFRETVAVDTQSPLKEALTDAPGVANLPDLTIQQYASLCAEREVKPAEQEMTCQKYGIADEATRGALDAHWQRLFQTQPQVQERWQELFSQYVAWLRHQG
jgi:hypothetical protein